MPWYNRTPIDIIIPFHGQYASVRNCMESVVRYTAVERYRITLVDDGSPNRDFIEQVKKTGLVGCVRLAQQAGFGTALQAGFQATEFPWVVFLNSDTEVHHSHWLNHLRRTMENLKSQGVKLVSSRMNDGGTGSYPDELIHPDGMEAGRDIVVDQPLPLVACMVNRALFKAIGGFVKDYPYGWYEDEELFWRMKSCGYKQAVSGASWVRHLGGLTVKEMGREVREVMESNKGRCLAEIKPLWERMARENGEITR